MAQNRSDGNLTPTEYYQRMFRATRGGKLKLWCRLFPSEVKNELTMLWSAEDIPVLAELFQTLERQLTSIAPMYKQLLSDPAAREQLSPELAQIWNTYVLPLPGHPAQLSTALKCRQAALERLPMKGCSPAGMICCANRYTRLLELAAPDIILRHERGVLMKDFALYHFAKPFEVCRYCGHALPPDEVGKPCPVCDWIEDGADYEKISEANQVPLKYFHLLSRHRRTTDL